MANTPFLGGHDVSRAINLTDAQLVNLFLEVAQAEASEKGVFYMPPGLTLYKMLGQGPIRGTIGLGNQLVVVSGNLVFVIQSNGLVQQLGPISSNSGPVSMIANTTQVAFFDGVNGFLVDGGVLSVITLPFSGPVSASYQDGFGLVSQLNSQVFWQSAVSDLSTWGSLHFTSADGSADNIVAIHEFHREQWVFKTEHIEVYIDAGLIGFAFQRLDGVFPEVGCAAQFSVASSGDNLIWLGRSARGEGVVYMNSGYDAQPISTHSITRIIQSFSRIDDAVAYTYQEDGHNWYVIHFPSGNMTFAYDISGSMEAKQPLWHVRAAFANGQFNRHWAWTHTFFNGQHIVGDYRNGNLYVASLDTQQDNGTPRKWLRSWRATGQESFEPVSFKSLQISMQTGVGIAQDANPAVMLRWSDDGGYSWSSYRNQKCGPAGATAQRVKFNALGGTTRGGGQDRIWELSSTDPADWALTGADQESA